MKTPEQLHIPMPDLQDPELFRTVLDSLQTGVSLVDRNGKILFWNQGAERLTGHKRHEVVGRPSRDNILVHCNGQGCVACGATCPFTRTLHEGRPQEARVQLRHKEGHPVHVLMRIAPIRDSHGSIVGIAESFDEQQFASDRDRDQQNLIEHGCVDGVTDVPNREFTEFHLGEIVASFARYRLPFGIMLVQIDQFDSFRASYGRPAGDAVLRVVAQTMKNSLRPSDFLGRWAKDEFLAILTSCGSAEAEKTGERIRKVVRYAGLQWWGDQLAVTSSAGYGIAQAGDTVDSLVQRAQDSLKQACIKQVAAAAVGSPGSPESSEI
jgi:diguanylate cyclase (GGDEF)-like protein/PAS domain S-box-containing protein